MLKNKKLGWLILASFFFAFSFVSAETKEWNFEDSKDYIFNSKQLNIVNGKVMPAMVFTLAESIPEDDTQSWGAASADFNGDGKLDVYVANWGQNKLWINQGNNKYIAKDIDGDEGNSQAAVAADFNGDGAMDIYVANYNGQNKLWINDGKANFSVFEIDGDGGYSFGVAVKDFNEDGILDIYVHNADGDNKLWYGGFYSSETHSPWIMPVNYQHFKNSIDDFSADFSGDLSFQVTIDGGFTWYYWDGNQWAQAVKINGEDTSSIQDIVDNIQSLIDKSEEDSFRFKWRAFLKLNGSSGTSLSKVSLSYDEPNYQPVLVDNDLPLKVVEGSSAVTTMEASDKNKKQEITFSLDGEDAQFFVIDPKSGELSFRILPDYEDPQDKNGDNIYKIKVRASDNGYPEESDELDLEIEILNQEIEFTSFNGEEKVEFATTEGKKEILNLSVKKKIESDSQIIYKIIPGPDSSNFFIDQNSGTLSFVENSDYENPKDENGDNIYEISIEALDEGSQDVAVQNFEITVLDVEENEAPVILTGDSEEISSDEFKKMVTKIKVSDPNNDRITFALGEYGDSKLFEIDSDSGELSFLEAPDYENPKDRDRDNVYEVEVVVSDDGNPSLSTSKIIRVYVNNLGRLQILFYRADSNEEVCKDSKASNFSPNGIHNQNLCIYEKDDYNYGQKKEIYNCPADQILNQNMIIGDRDGKYSGWEKSVIKEVKILQNHLKRLGFDIGIVDGDFGPKTYEGVKSLQKAFGIDVDGIVGPEFRRKINSSCVQDSGGNTEPLIEEEKDISEVTSESYNRDDLNRSLDQMKWLIQDLINQIRL